MQILSNWRRSKNIPATIPPKKAKIINKNSKRDSYKFLRSIIFYITIIISDNRLFSQCQSRRVSQDNLLVFCSTNQTGLPIFLKQNLPNAPALYWYPIENPWVQCQGSRANSLHSSVTGNSLAVSQIYRYFHRDFTTSTTSVGSSDDPYWW